MSINCSYSKLALNMVILMIIIINGVYANHDKMSIKD